MQGALQVPPGGITSGFLGFLIAICLITLVLVILVAIWMYRDAQSRRMDGTVWVVLLVLASVFGGLLGLVIVTVIYLVVRGNHPIGGGYPVGYGPYPGAAYPPVAPCPVCGGPMVWYPQYQRWYCPRCAQYR